MKLVLVALGFSALILGCADAEGTISTVWSTFGQNESTTTTIPTGEIIIAGLPSAVPPGSTDTEAETPAESSAPTTEIVDNDDGTPGETTPVTGTPTPSESSPGGTALCTKAKTINVKNGNLAFPVNAQSLSFKFIGNANFTVNLSGVTLPCLYLTGVGNSSVTVTSDATTSVGAIVFDGRGNSATTFVLTGTPLTYSSQGSAQVTVR